MLSTMDLREVRRRQEELRREADANRMAATNNAKETRPVRTLRVLGLRLSLAA